MRSILSQLQYQLWHVSRYANVPDGQTSLVGQTHMVGSTSNMIITDLYSAIQSLVYTNSLRFTIKFGLSVVPRLGSARFDWLASEKIRQKEGIGKTQKYTSMLCSCRPLSRIFLDWDYAAFISGGWGRQFRLGTIQSRKVVWEGRNVKFRQGQESMH